MLFNSYTFIIFLAFVLVVSRLIRSWTWRKVFLLGVSYLFYAAWNPPFVALLWISTVADWYLAKGISMSDTKLRKRLFLGLSLVLNLGMLIFFKYGNFALDNFTYLVNSLGFEYQPAAMNIILPVGISFYTFQTLSYTFDVYKGIAKPWHSFIDYALYVTFFPQLVAGPIVRAVDFLPQCEESKLATGKQMGWGMTLLVVGLFNKMVIADSFLSPVTEAVFDSDLQCGMIQSWTGALAFTGQIFCDFAGYSTCAIGIAMCLGFVLPRNFRFPYAAVGFSDFWSRWHISLSTWLKDYLYISMGGNRKGKHRTYINIMMTMLIGGLWHGASWLFVIWGGLHGLLLVSERLLCKGPWAKWSIWKNAFTKFALGILTFVCVCFVWVFFRARTLDRAVSIVRSMVDFSHISNHPDGFILKHGYFYVLLIMMSMLFVHWFIGKESLEVVASRLPGWLRISMVTVMIVCVVTSFAGEDRAFIYFQF